MHAGSEAAEGGAQRQRGLGIQESLGPQTVEGLRIPATDSLKQTYRARATHGG